MGRPNTEREDIKCKKDCKRKEKNKMKPTKVTEELGAIIVGSSGCVSTGINIPNLETIIFASPTKSRIKTLQSIGRTLRIGDHSDKAVLWDIVDDLSDKGHKNFAIKHFMERVKIYSEEKFKFKLHKINMF